MARTSPEHRAAKKLESLGFTVGDVEKWIPMAKRRVDLFGIIDLVGLRGPLTIGLQVTDTTSVAKHITKMIDEPRLWDCLTAGWLVECWGVRRKPTRDGSFAVARYFELTKRGGVTAFNGSQVL